MDKKYLHPLDPSKYLKCDLLGRVYIVQCPQNQSFSQACQECFMPNTSCTTGPKTPLTSTMTNPCTVSNLMAGRFFFPYSQDKAKYIHCDVWGKAWVMNCPLGEVWNQPTLTCELLTTTPTPTRPTVSGSDFTCCPTCPLHTAPCTDANLAANKFLHPLRGDRHHYIQCDLTGRMYCPMPCNPSIGGGLDFFDPQTSTCVDGALSIDNIVG